MYGFENKWCRANCKKKVYSNKIQSVLKCIYFTAGYHEMSQYCTMFTQFSHEISKLPLVKGKQYAALM